MKAFIFPGQGSQFVGMAEDLYNNNSRIKERIAEADQILGFSLSDIMFKGPEEELVQTKFTQPAIFVHSVALFETLDMKPDMAAGHSLGEFSALASVGALEFKSALELVALRGSLMQEAGKQNEGTMAAVIGLGDHLIDQICREASELSGKPVVPANYNCPGQLVISGDTDAVKKAVELAKEKGCRLAKMLPVSGAFHSPLMKPAVQGLKEKVDEADINKPECPIFANFTAEPTTDPEEIRKNLVNQLTNPVKWTSTLENMNAHGSTEFIEVGPGKVLQGLVKRTLKDVKISGYQ